MCLQFQYSFSEIMGKKYHVILAQVIRDTLQSNT